MVSLSHDFRTEIIQGQLHPFHHRDLGIKEGNLYPEKKWVDVAIDGVSLDDTAHWENEIDYLQYVAENARDTGGEEIMIGDKIVDPTIRESGSFDASMKGTGESKNQGALGKSDQDTLHRKWFVKNYKRSHTDKEVCKDKNYFRKKKIPKSRLKKYPVKPIRDQDLEKKKVNQEKFEDVAHSKEFEEKVAIESVQDDLNEEYWETHSPEDYPYFENDVVNDFGNRKDKFGFIYFEENPGKSLVTFYEEETDSYDYSAADMWAGSSMPVYLGDFMWSLPKEWIEPEIDWLKIWTEMDFKRCGFRRSFEYFPKNQLNRPEIRFHLSSL
jgi:hypothetical protein